MNTKNRKSLFTWCIRTLAVSLLPTMLLVSCASDDSSDSTVADTTAPVVASIVPAPDATDRDPATTITITFSEEIAATTVDVTSDTNCTGSVLLSNDDFTSCVATDFVAQDENTKFIFDPIADLVNGETYQVRVTTAITDVAGNSLAENYTSSFTIKAADAGGISVTAASSLTNALSSAGIDSAEATALVEAANAQVASDNLTDSTDPATVLPSFLKGALAGISSVSAADQTTALHTVMSTVTGLIGELEQLTSRLGRTGDAKTAFESLLANLIQTAATNLGTTGITDLGTALGTVVNAVVASLDEANTPATDIADAVKVATNTAVGNIDKLGLEASLVDDAIGTIATQSISALDQITGLDEATVSSAAAGAVNGAVEGLTTLKTNIEAAGGSFDAASITAATTQISDKAGAAAQALTSLSNTTKNILSTSLTTAVKTTIAAQQEALGLSDTDVSDINDDVDAQQPAPLPEDEQPSDNQTTDGTDNQTDGSDNQTDGTDGGTSEPDTTAPVITLPAIADTTSVSGVGTVTTDSTPNLTFTSTEAGTLAMTNNSSCNDVTNNTVVAGSNSLTLDAFSADGTYNCEFIVTDAAGNASAKAYTGNFVVDFNAPTMDNVTINDGDDNTTTLALSLDLYAITDSVGTGVSAYYAQDGTSSAPAASATGWVSIAPHTNGNNEENVSYTLTDQDDNETKTVYVFVKDKAGNVSVAYSDTIFMPTDDANPILSQATIEDIATGTDNATMTNSATVQVNITAYDNVSGSSVTGMKYVLVNDNTTYTPTTIGDNETLFNQLVSSRLIQTPTFAADNTTSVNFTFSDNSSASKTLYVWVADGAKRFASDNVTASIYVDAEPPTIDNVTITGSYGADNLTTVDNTSYTTTSSVSIKLDYHDDENGTNVYQYYILEAASDNTSAATAFATELTSNLHVDNLTGDNLTGFTIGSDSNDPSDNLSGVTRANLTFWSFLDNGTNDNVSTYTSDNYSATDNTSTISYTLTNSGARTLYVAVKDAVGNYATYTKSITFDNESPTGNASALSFGGSDLSSDESRTDNLTITLDNTTLFTDSGVGVHRLYLTDNASAAPTDNTSTFWSWIPNGNSDNLSFTFTRDSSGGSIEAGDNLTLYIYAIDKLSNYDNSTSGRISKSIIFDNATPSASGDNVTVDSTSVDVVTADNQTFWVNSETIGFTAASLTAAASDNDTSLTFAASDNGTSAENYGAAPQFKGTAGGTSTVYIWAKDSLGYSAVVDNLTVKFDTTGPTLDNITLKGQVNGADNTTTTDNETLTIVFDNATDGSGIGIKYYYASTTNSFVDNVSLWDDYTAGDNGTFTITDIETLEGQSVTVYTWLIDNLTNYSATPRSATIAIEDEAPVIESVSMEDNATISSASDNITVTISATDNIQVKSYYIATSSGTTPTGTSNWTDFDSTSDTISTGVPFSLSNVSTLTDNLTLYVWLKDASGNITDNYTADSIELIDNVSPTLSSVVLSYPTSGSTVNITGTTANVQIVGSDLFGVTGYYITDNASYTPQAGEYDNFTSPGTSVAETVSHTFDNNGLTNGSTLTLYVWIRDEQGNADNSSDSINYVVP